MTHRTDRKKAGRVVPVMALGLLFAAAAAIAPACKGVEAQTIAPIPPPSVGEIGDPCHLEDEDRPGSAGSDVISETIASPVKACSSKICLANHVQGRSDCPLGQEAPIFCTGPGDPGRDWQGKFSSCRL